MLDRRSLCLCACALLWLSGSATAVDGDWSTDPDAALRLAAETKRPVLAVAMDHG